MKIRTITLIVCSFIFINTAFSEVNFKKNLTNSSNAEPSEYLNAAKSNLGVSKFRNSDIFKMDKNRGAVEESIYQKRSLGTILIGTDQSTGSGFLVTQKGHAITNYHVVEGYETVGVAFKRLDDKELSAEDVITAKVIKYDEVNDLAMLEIPENKIPSYAKPMPLAKNVPGVGSDAHAIGHPSGQFWSYTKGYISQVRNNFKWSEINEGNVLQIQTPINPGNSGGPLLNNEAEIIGVNSFKDSKNDSMNYAVSVVDLKKFLSMEGNKTAQKTAKQDCFAQKSKTDLVKDAENGDAYYTDYSTRCDGKVNMIVINPVDKTKPIATFLDSNGDDVPDIIMYDLDRNGKIDLSMYDTDYDGKYDQKGTHTTGGVFPDKLEPYNG